jgi:isohexenylglutaconyl-CoA hydratase
MTMVEIEDVGVVRHLWLARPERRNAMNMAMVDAVLAAASDAVATGRRVLVFRGRGGHFCSGGDVSEMAAAAAERPQARDAIATINRRFGEMLVTINRLPMAVVAVCEGAVIGGGFGLAAVADVTLAVQGARFRLPETSLGITPAQIMPFLVQRMGPSWSRRLAVTGESLDASQAVRVGLAHEALEPEDVDARLAVLLGHIRRSEPRALAATKRLTNRVATEGISAALLDAAADEFAVLARSEQAQQGFAARLSKAAPPWAGT